MFPLLIIASSIFMRHGVTIWRECFEYSKSREGKNIKGLMTSAYRARFIWFRSISVVSSQTPFENMAQTRWQCLSPCRNENGPSAESADMNWWQKQHCRSLRHSSADMVRNQVSLLRIGSLQGVSRRRGVFRSQFDVILWHERAQMYVNETLHFSKRVISFEAFTSSIDMGGREVVAAVL